eukprot:TRINITY_DN3154_c0_g1_i1.p1 TRINITY_DN3154_c0_g1~~TRINITY_DN3154_c0_g1_i1.p1  ORF type:complete len:269 (-),score=70.87 TRINITY_DN3154_c0_g1_i1:14-730(-)
MNVIKGAIQKVLGTPVTAHIQFTSKTKGRIAVVYEKPTEPTKDEIKKVQQVVNGIIVKNVPITVVKMNRKEAEEKFGSNIYDLIKPPEDLQELNILQIENWNVNAVKDGDFLPSTGSLNAIEVERINFRPQKSHVEFCFEVVPETDKRSAGLLADVAAAVEAPKVAVAATKPVVKKTATKPVAAYSEELVAFFFQQLEKHGDSAEGRAALRRALLNEATITLNAVQNSSYAAGFKAKQ